MSLLNKKSGFTLIELLVVVAIIGILSSVVLVSLNSARVKARDTQRKSILRQLVNANEMYYVNNGDYPPSAGWFTNPNHGGLDNYLIPSFISKIQDDPGNNGVLGYMYWRKDDSSCPVISSQKYSFYAKLENPSNADLATIVDNYDTCVKNTWGMNYKIGN